MKSWTRGDRIAANSRAILNNVPLVAQASDAREWEICRAASKRRSSEYAEISRAYEASIATTEDHILFNARNVACAVDA